MQGPNGWSATVRPPLVLRLAGGALKELDQMPFARGAFRLRICRPMSRDSRIHRRFNTLSRFGVVDTRSEVWTPSIGKNLTLFSILSIRIENWNFSVSYTLTDRVSTNVEAISRSTSHRWRHTQV